VVKDGLSDSDQRSVASHHLDRNSNDPRQGSSVGSLTQELAQLLAALITQNQANKGSAPTNAELISLANLISAAAARPTIPSASKEGLSTLSHAQPTAAPPLEVSQDDEPMPIPSTWLQPLARDGNPWFKQQLYASVLGLITGLMIVVPAVLWLSGAFSPQRSSTAVAREVPAAANADARTAPEAKFEDARTVRAPMRPADPVRSAGGPDSEVQPVKGNIEQASPPTPVEAKSPPVAPTIAAAQLIDPDQARIEGVLAQAGQRIESGDVGGAREMLAGVDGGGEGRVSFALAETYDPNMLAAWGTRGVAADADKARTLYQKAFHLGVARAQNRLEALRP
jgi:hypothetical protein